MKFDLTVACKDCPFRKKNGIRLRKGRIQEIHEYVTTWEGATFSCHKTSDRVEDEKQHCAGAIAYAHKLGTDGNQLTRFALHISGHKREDYGPIEEVFGTLAAWKETSDD